MASPLFTFQEYFKYQIRAKNAHGLHSPFLYTLYNEVIHQKDSVDEKKLLLLRKKFRKSDEIITFLDPKSGHPYRVKAGTLSKQVASSHRFSRFLKRLIDKQAYQRVLETGTSTGLNTIYMAHSKAKTISTIEGAPEIASLAQKRFDQLALGHIEIVTGKVQHVFEETLEKQRPELIFLDADHRSETIEFYLDKIEQAPTMTDCIIIHDIHWSKDMKQYWEHLISLPKYNLSIDVFQAGILFPNHRMEKQHFTIRF